MASIKKKVLIIDDDAALVEMISTELELEGFEVISALSGETGLVSAMVDLPDIILLDIIMPDLDGWEICRRLRSDQRTKYIPIIILTALGKTRHVVKGFELGVDDYLAKPFDNSVLLARLRTVLLRSGKESMVDPLTNLPGKNKIYEESRRRMEARGRFFAFIYVDINNLREVNYRYGIEKGNEVIAATARLLEEIAMVEENEFLGYMGEDDFIIITVPVRVNQIFSSATEKFESTMSSICPDMLHGSDSPDVSDDVRLSLAFAVVTNEKRQFGDPVQLKNVALEMLKLAQRENGHALVNFNDHL